MPIAHIQFRNPATTGRGDRGQELDAPCAQGLYVISFKYFIENTMKIVSCEQWFFGHRSVPGLQTTKVPLTFSFGPRSHQLLLAVKYSL